MFLFFVLLIYPVFACISYNKNTKTANCKESAFSYFPQELPTSTEVLILSQNSIQRISNADIKRYESLKTIYLGFNQITSIESHAFSSLNSLTYLQLDNNRLDQINFFLPRTLSTLSITKNRITRVPSGFLSGLKRFETLDLTANNIESIDKDAFKGVGIEKYTFKVLVDLSSNLLRYLPEEAFLPLVKNPNPYGKLKIVVNSNPIHCNCLVKWIPLLFLPNQKISPSSVDIQGTCGSPVNLIDVEIEELDPKLLVCDPPEIILNVENSEVTIDENSSIELQCKARGDPTPRIFWMTRMYSRLDVGADKGRYKVNENGNIQISQASQEDSGRLTCVAYNVAGNQTFIFTLSVVSQPLLARPTTFVLLFSLALIIVAVIILVLLFILVKMLYMNKSAESFYSSYASIPNSSNAYNECCELSDLNKTINKDFLDGSNLEKFSTSTKKSHKYCSSPTSDTTSTINNMMMESKGTSTDDLETSKQSTGKISRTSPLESPEKSSEHPYLSLKRTRPSKKENIAVKLTAQSLYTEPDEYTISPTPMIKNGLFKTK